MNTVFRPFLRSCNHRALSTATRLPTPVLRRPLPLARPGGIVANSIVIHRRTAASTVTNRPASQTLDHAATNVKEELGNTAADVAKIIAASNVTSEVADSKDVADSFLGITYKNIRDVPQPVLMLGLTGGLPYVGASLTTVWLAREASLAISGVVVGIDPGVALTVLDDALNLQVTYGAVLLSFLGALHWGMEIAAYGGQKGYPRLALGTAPVLLAWSTLALEPTMALAVQWVGFTALWYADSKATMAGWTPKWYSQYRFYLSVLVGTCIIGSLAACSYWGPVGGHGLLSHDLDLLREERKKYLPEQRGVIPGDIEAVPAGEDADHYTIIHRRKTEKERTEED